MRVLKVTQIYHPYLEKGGPVVKVRALAEYLARRGHRVTVLTADLGPRKKQKGKKGEKGEGEQGGTVRVAYLRTLTRYRTLTVNPGVVPFCLQRLRAFDVVHIYGLYDLLGAVVAWFCRRWAIPYVVEPMGMYRPIVRSLGKKRFYHRLLGRGLVQGAGCLIATSEQERQELIEEGVCDEKVMVRRNGLDMCEFEKLPPHGAFRRELGLSDGEPLVLYLGRLSRKKGLDLLLRAFTALPLPARLAIVGPDDQDGCVQELEHLRMQLDLQGRVTLIGPRFGVQKLEALVDADLFVLPSRNENFGNAVAEAIACGVPVVVTDQCGIAPIVRDRVGLVVEYAEGKWGYRSSLVAELPAYNDGRVGALREAMERLLTDEELRERFRAKTEQVRWELSWEEPVEQQEQIYREVLRTKGRAM